MIDLKEPTQNEEKRKRSWKDITSKSLKKFYLKNICGRMN